MTLSDHQLISPDHLYSAKIMVVDDCEDNIYLLTQILNIAGYVSVSSSTDSSKVCDLHAENDYDLILLDMHMPGLNGLEVMECLKNLEKESYLPVLAITGDSRYKLAALEAGARDFITKPYDFAELKMRIRNILEVRLLYKTVAEQSRIQQEMALHDPLTGLPNRRLLLDRMEIAMQHATRQQQMMAVMYMDLDGFKGVNDQHGHHFGDELLKMVAARLTEATRRDDTVSRIGGDEFVMLLSEINDVYDVVQPASKVLHAMAMPFLIGGESIVITASIGVAFYLTSQETALALLARADKALYDAKNSGKNRYYFTELPVWSGSVV